MSVQNICGYAGIEVLLALQSKWYYDDIVKYKIGETEWDFSLTCFSGQQRQFYIKANTLIKILQ